MKANEELPVTGVSHYLNAELLLMGSREQIMFCNPKDQVPMIISPDVYVALLYMTSAVPNT